MHLKEEEEEEGGRFELRNLQDVLMVQRPLICQKIKVNLVSRVTTPLKDRVQ